MNNRKIKISAIILIILPTLLLTSCSKLHLAVRDKINENKSGYGSFIMYSKSVWDMFIECDIIAHVRFIEKKPHFSKEKRAEYVFEVVEWLKGSDTTKTQISVYSTNHKYCAGTYSYTESYEKDTGKKIKFGDEMLLTFDDPTDGIYYMPTDSEFFIRLEDDMTYIQEEYSYAPFVMVEYPDGVEELSKEQFITCVRKALEDPEAFREKANKYEEDYQAKLKEEKKKEEEKNS